MTKSLAHTIEVKSMSIEIIGTIILRTGMMRAKVLMAKNHGNNENHHKRTNTNNNNTKKREINNVRHTQITIQTTFNKQHINDESSWKWKVSVCIRS